MGVIIIRHDADIPLSEKAGTDKMVTNFGGDILFGVSAGVVDLPSLLSRLNDVN